MTRIFGREPAVAVEMLGGVALALLLLIPMSDEIRGVSNALVPALKGVITAVFALVLALGVDLPDATQVGILAVVSAVGAFFVRTQVTAPQAPATGGLSNGRHSGGEYGGGPTPAGNPAL
jgi:uncharacterized membrane protein